MIYLLDTNAVSEFSKSRTADPGFRTWAERQTEDSYAISCLTLMEIETGIGRLERRDPIQAVKLRAWFTESEIFRQRSRILPIDDHICLRCAGLHVPDPKSPIDALIAATALVHGLIVVTRNFSDFQNIDVPLLCPWTHP